MPASFPAKTVLITGARRAIAKAICGPPRDGANVGGVDVLATTRPPST